MMALGRRVAQVLLQLRPSCHHCEIYRWCSAVAQAAAAVIEKSAELLIIYSPYHRIHDARLVRADARASSHVRWCACRRSFYGSMAVASTPHAHVRLPCGPGARGPNQSDCRSRSRPSAGLGKQLLPARAAACAVLSRDVCVSDQVWANGTSSSSQASSCRLLGRIRIIGTFLITRACGVTTATLD